MDNRPMALECLLPMANHGKNKISALTNLPKIDSRSLPEATSNKAAMFRWPSKSNLRLKQFGFQFINVIAKSASKFILTIAPVLTKLSLDPV